MTGWFEIGIDQKAGLLRLTMGGFFDTSGVEGLRSALSRAVETMRAGGLHHRTLCDIRTMEIQSQDVVRQFTQLVADPRLRSERLAFVTGATLARLQARRLTDREGVAFFTDSEAALGWLNGGPQRATRRTDMPGVAKGSSHDRTGRMQGSVSDRPPRSAAG